MRVKTITFLVELNFTQQGKIRYVHVPVDEIKGRNYIEDLNVIWKYGQNEVQPKPMPSVSMGDVIRLRGERYLVRACSYKRLKEGDITVGFIPQGQ
jgi:hypothetical protein